MASDERHVRSYANGSGTTTNHSTTSELEETLIDVKKNFGEMQIYHRFMKVSTTGVTLLLNSICDNSEAIIGRLLATYNEKIRKGIGDIETLDGLRKILCHEYQLLIKTHFKECLSESPESLDPDIKSFFVRSNESWNAEELSLLYDILVLQLVLRSNARQFTQLFDRFYETQENLPPMSDEMQNIYMRVSECFADSHNLRRYLRKESCNDADLERQRIRIETTIKSWMKQEENLEWRLLASLLPKLAIAFGIDNIVSPLWSEVFGKSDDLEKTLASLCVIADICFPSEKEMVYEIHYEQCVQKEFWSIVQQGLLSGVSQHRKQALYLAKRGIDFVGSHETAIKTKLQKTKENIVPFVCTRLPLADLSVEKMKKSFFLLIEALEEKQKHLVLPALSHLPSLIEAYNDHKSCGDCFNVVWLHCILKRILQHDNDAINIIGLEAILKADLDIFDESFLDFVAIALNNTFLYDCDGDYEPRIVKLLKEFFRRSEAAGVTLINAFVRAISRVSWGPIALSWVLKTMRDTIFKETVVHNIWTIEELKCVATLVSKIVIMSCLQLRMASLQFILKTFDIYNKEIANQSDLEVIINTQSLCIVNGHTENVLIASKFLTDAVKPSDAALYITQSCDTFFTIERHIETWAISIFLLLWSMPPNGKDVLNSEKALHRLFQKLIDADNRPYADPILIPKVLEFASHLINYASVHESTDAIKRIVSPYKDTIMKVLRRSLEKQKIERFDEYLLALRALIDVDSPNKVAKRGPWWPDTEKQLEGFEEKCIAYIKGISFTANRDHYCRSQLSYVTKVLYVCRERTFSRRPELAKIYIYPLLQFLESESESTFNATFETIAKIVCQIITKSPPDKWPTNIHWIEKLRSLVEIGGEEMIEPIAVTLCELLEKAPSLIIQDLATVHSIIRQSWRCAFHMKRDKDFFSAVTQLTWLIVNSNYLILDEAKEFAFEYVNEIMVEGERVPTLKRIFLASMKSLRPQDTLEFRKSLICCLLHGAVPRRDQRIEQTTLQDLLISYGYLEWNVNNTVRAQAIDVLLRVTASSEATEVRNNILVDLLKILEKNKNKRYFDNSQLHRLKHRVMQTLLILEPFLSETERKLLHDTMSALLIAESNQPSVRLMQEWLLTRIYIDNCVMRESIWNLFVTAVEERPGSIVSFASIVYHVSKSLRGDMQLSYITKAIQHLLPNCMGQQFNVRLYSQEILVQLFQMAPMSTEYKQIYEGVEKNLRENLKKSSIRVLDNFYFTDFDPMKRYSFEIIYWDLPRLTNVCSTEWIDTVVFANLDVDKTKVKVHDESVPLDEVKPMIKSTRPTGELVEDHDPSFGGGLNDIQKKIIPWKSMVPFYDDLSETSKATLSRRKIRNEDAGIIVVASLIDRPPNLGGLARTCEIFGAKELVIGSLRYAENQEFRTLSVSAEKWITITEVKPYLLQNYLLEKQSEGWNLVGAEQTANSTNLLEMEFDKKTILLLGNEKDGIPANLIPLLDKCVEIPQNGVVRSLNVHVTGAICIWQYAKQHIFT